MSDRPRAVRHAIITYLMESGDKAQSDGLRELIAGIHEYARDRKGSYTMAWTQGGQLYRRRTAKRRAKETA